MYTVSNLSTYSQVFFARVKRGEKARHALMPLVIPSRKTREYHVNSTPTTQHESIQLQMQKESRPKFHVISNAKPMLILNTKSHMLISNAESHANSNPKSYVDS